MDMDLLLNADPGSEGGSTDCPLELEKYAIEVALSMGLM